MIGKAEEEEKTTFRLIHRAQRSERPFKRDIPVTSDEAFSKSAAAEIQGRSYN